MSNPTAVHFMLWYPQHSLDADETNNQPWTKEKLEGVKTASLAEVSFYFNKDDCCNLDKCPSTSHNFWFTISYQDITHIPDRDIVFIGSQL